MGDDSWLGGSKTIPRNRPLDVAMPSSRPLPAQKWGTIHPTPTLPWTHGYRPRPDFIPGRSEAPRKPTPPCSTRTDNPWKPCDFPRTSLLPSRGFLADRKPRETRKPPASTPLPSLPNLRHQRSRRRHHLDTSRRGRRSPLPQHVIVTALIKEEQPTLHPKSSGPSPKHHPAPCPRECACRKEGPTTSDHVGSVHYSRFYL